METYRQDIPRLQMEYLMDGVIISQNLMELVWEPQE